MGIKPEGDRVRTALRWVSDQLKQDPSRVIVLLVDQAAMKFDLTPKESTELLQFYMAGKQDAGDG